MKRFLLLIALSVFLFADISLAQWNFPRQGKKRIQPPHGSWLIPVFPDERRQESPPSDVRISVVPDNTPSGPADSNQPEQKQQTIIILVPVKDQPEADRKDSVSPPPQPAKKPDPPVYIGRGYTGRIEIGADGIARPSEK